MLHFRTATIDYIVRQIFKLKSLITSEGLINYYCCCCDSTADTENVNARRTNSGTRVTQQTQFKVKSGVTATQLSQVGLASVRRCPTMSNDRHQSALQLFTLLATRASAFDGDEE